MSHPEQRHIPQSFSAPIDQSAGDTETNARPTKLPSQLGLSETQPGVEDAGLADFLHREFTIPAVDLYIEAKLKRTGLLAVLEQAGIVPKLEDPNPFDATTEADNYEQWWYDHPTEEAAFHERDNQRRQVLKYLHIGAVVSQMTGNRLYPGRVFPTFPPQAKP